MSHPWAEDAVFYAIYPLGLCGAPPRNDFQSAPEPRLLRLIPWLDHIQCLGATALNMGPLFESSAHGYDTADYYHVDRRLGDRATLRVFAQEVHRRGLRLVLDGVFNHVGRDFWAFRDLRARRRESPYAGWFKGLDFDRQSPYGDAFAYEGWAGHYDLVRLNQSHPDVRRHLFDAVSMWLEEFGIDGLRLDAADQLEPDFVAALSAHCRGLRSDFWLMGEIVHGDYRRLAGEGRCDSVTNYECYKGLYSSLNDRNYFEIAYGLDRQFGAGGIYRGLGLYNFVDNHDVNRAASNLTLPEHLYPLYCLLFSMPGIPSIYYGSEWGLKGQRGPHSDAGLRPALEVGQAGSSPQPELADAIARLAGLRRELPALRVGDYAQLHVAAEQFAFLRETHSEAVIVALNAAAQPAALDLGLPWPAGRLVDRLNGSQEFRVEHSRVHLEIPPTWARILEFQEMA